MHLLFRRQIFGHLPLYYLMRLIGIKTGAGDSLVMKNLQENTWYPFGEYTEPTKANGWIWQTEGQKAREEACKAMYKPLAENKESSLEITANCIVGKNGSGKSSLLDLFYRIINNFSLQLFDRKWEDNDPNKNPQRGHYLEEANSFDATLFFETDGVVGSIRYCYGDFEYNYHSAVENVREEQQFLQSNMSKTKLEKITRHFFYSICTNYSIHSLNEHDYTPNKLWIDKDENVNGKWLKGLFHKNDGYVVPIVMVPFRDREGIIDIGNENALAKTRLATLGVLFASQGKKFLGEYSPMHIVYRFRHDCSTYYNQKFNELYRSWLPLNNQASRLKREIKSRWKRELDSHHENYKNLPKAVKEAILNYIAYKTFKTCLHYRKYGEMLGIRSLTEEEQGKARTKNKGGVYLEWNENGVNDIVKEIHFQDSTVHINQKIQQLLFFIDHENYNVKNLEVPDDFIEDPTKLVGYGWTKSEASVIYTEKVDGKSKRVRFKTYDEMFLRMPPAIFDWDISFTKDGHSEETLSQMSSGERQFMHSLSYIIYHLNNLQSVKDGSYRVRYHNVSLIFDEAELYYHPNFQRKFISSLIKMLSWSNINPNIIRGVNILVVTHSPFVLSDVPKCHTLYLRDGMVDNDNHKETFCGNVHQLLGDNFFMEYSFGEVAKENVEEIIKLYNQNQKDQKDKQDSARIQYQNNEPKYKFVTSIIADDYLKRKVEEMMKELDILYGSRESEEEIDRKISDLRKEIEYLNNKKRNIKR